MNLIKRVPSSPEEFSIYINNNPNKIFIFGADIAGKILLKILNEKIGSTGIDRELKFQCIK